MKHMIQEEMKLPSKFTEVNGSKLHYIQSGEGDPILFLHGIPAYSYVWRNIIPSLKKLGRCIALDLPGFGLSDKPDISYSVKDHIQYLEKFIDKLQLQNITLVMHGWGSVIGLDYAMRHEENCKGLVFYEAFLRSIEGENISLPFQEQLMTLAENIKQHPELLDDGWLVDKMISQNVMRHLSEKEMQYYRQPFSEPGSCKPILKYLHELTDADDLAKIEQLILRNTNKLMQSKLPKLLLYAVPGFVTPMSTVMWAKKNLPKLEIFDLGEFMHYVQESNPEILAEAISVWVQSVEVACA